MMAKRFGRASEEAWHIMTVREEKISKGYNKTSGRVMFPSTHDLFDFPYIEEAYMTVLSKLLESGNSVLVTTKPRINVIRKIVSSFFDSKENLQFQFL